MGSKTISHRGRVMLVDGDRIDVEMLVESACSECHVKGACGMGQSETKMVELLTKSAQFYKVGEEVDVCIEEKMGIRAAVYAYVVPFFVMLGVLLVAKQVELSELTSGIATLASVGVYYIGYRIFRKRIERDLVFKLSKIEAGGDNC